MLTLTDTERQELREALAKVEHLAREHARILAGCRAILARPPVDMLAPAYHPERMGYMNELDVGDRAMWDCSWHEVTAVRHHPDGNVTLHANDAIELASPGSYAIRIQKRGEPYYPSDGPMPEGVTEVDPW